MLPLRTDQRTLESTHGRIFTLRLTALNTLLPDIRRGQFSLIVRKARATGNSAFGSVASPARTAISYSSLAFQRFCPFGAIFQIRMTDRFIVDVP